MRDGTFGADAASLFKTHGAAKPHEWHSGPSSERQLSGIGPMYREAPGVDGMRPSSWSRTCTERACALCGKKRLEPGTSQWEGTGVFGYLCQPGEARDPPPAGRGRGTFRLVPAPPPKWMHPRFTARRTPPTRTPRLCPPAATQPPREAAAEAAAEPRGAPPRPP